MRAIVPIVPLLLILLAAPAGAQPTLDLQREIAARYGASSYQQDAGSLRLAEARVPEGASGAQDEPWLPSPRGALLRSLAVPGWGQIYNRQPLKAPVIWAGLGTLVGVSIYSNSRVILFRRAAIFDDCLNRPGDVPPDACENFEAFADEFARADELTAGPLNSTSARNLRDQFSRQRDLFVLVSFLAYGLQALDAFVAAELADFDTGEDLIVGLGTAPAGPSIALRWRF